jgi:hypothetical protein
MATEQDLKHHTMLDPPFHLFLIPVGMALFITSILQLYRHPSWMAGAQVLILFWLALLAFKTRLYSLKVQDRVIRLEERLRLQSVLPAALQPRIADLSVDQLIGLRFASDAELPGLVEKTLAGNWNRKQIKEAIVTWRPDNWRV